MSETPIYDETATAQSFDPIKMKGIHAKLTSFEGPKRRTKRETAK